MDDATNAMCRILSKHEKGGLVVHKNSKPKMMACIGNRLMKYLAAISGGVADFDEWLLEDATINRTTRRSQLRAAAKVAGAKRKSSVGDHGKAEKKRNRHSGPSHYLSLIHI